MRASLFASALLSGFFISPVQGADVVMSPQGYSGLSITPTADLLGWGTMSFVYDSQLPGASRPEGHNFVAGFGLLPFLEVSGRIASNTMHCNLYAHPGCGIRDLSANVKAGIGFGENDRYRIAIGGTDLGGIVTFFRSYYGVVTYDAGSLEYSLGIAKRADVRPGGQSPLHGPFGSIAYQPLNWLHGHVEYSDGVAWAGARLSMPDEWLPKGWKIHAGLNARLSADDSTERTWWNLGVTIPLHHVQALPRSTSHMFVGASGAMAAAESVTSEEGVTTVPVSPSASYTAGPDDAGATSLGPSATRPAAEPSASASSLVAFAGESVKARESGAVSERSLRSLAKRLQEKGLEDISVGRLPGGEVAVDVNNATYNWNVLDAVGVSLGVIGRELAATKTSYRLVMRQRQTPIVAITGQADCLISWFESASVDCSAFELHTPGIGALENLHDGVVWEVQNTAPSWKTLRVGFEPVLNSNVATEYGVFDHSVGIGLNVEQPLWNGASVNVRYIAPLDESSDFEARGAYGARRLKEGVDRALINQTLRVPLERWLYWGTPQPDDRWGLSAVTAHVSLGKVSRVYDGAHGQLRWEPGEGLHRVGLEGGYFKHKDKSFGPVYGPAFIEPRTSRPVLSSYRYLYLHTETQFEATAGRFVNHDKGVQFVLRQWFGDTAVALFYKRTRFDYQPEHASFVGLELTFPLGPRKDMSPGSLIQVRGTSRWDYGVQTLTGGENNMITTGHTVRPGEDALNGTFNSDRSSLGYFVENLSRVRRAATDQQWFERGSSSPTAARPGKQ